MKSTRGTSIGRRIEARADQRGRGGDGVGVLAQYVHVHLAEVAERHERVAVASEVAGGHDRARSRAQEREELRLRRAGKRLGGEALDAHRARDDRGGGRGVAGNAREGGGHRGGRALGAQLEHDRVRTQAPHQRADVARGIVHEHVRYPDQV